jgi:hypothetical protein
LPLDLARSDSVSTMRLPEPMLARPGTLPLGSGYAYEVKWDGFRAIVSTENGLQVRSRRGWDMTALLRELAKLPGGLVLDARLRRRRWSPIYRESCPKRLRHPSRASPVDDFLRRSFPRPRHLGDVVEWFKTHAEPEAFSRTSPVTRIRTTRTWPRRSRSSRSTSPSRPSPVCPDRQEAEKPVESGNGTRAPGSFIHPVYAPLAKW